MGDVSAAGSVAGSVAGWLDTVGRELPAGRELGLEYSVRLSAAGVSTSGRCTCWVPGGPGPAIAGTAVAFGRLLGRLGAPPAVLAAHAGLELPVRRGIGIDVTGGKPVHRLYLHGRRASPLADHYRSWRWGPALEPRACDYSFHFLPETASGLRPADLVDRELRPMLESLLAEERFRQMSGFWLRCNADGVIDQLDLAFPWHPAAGSLAGLVALAQHLGVGAADGWRELPVRHVAFRVSAGPAVVTLYVSGPAAGSLPTSERELQDRAARGAARTGRLGREWMLARVPAPVPHSGGGSLDEFYGGDPATWRRVLGARLHYHHGLFDEALAPDMDAALDRAVTELYPFIPAHGRLYDVGCGWGGSLDMWIRDLGCPSLGLTISRTQFRYAASHGLPVRWGDAEQTLPPGFFDCAVLLESFEHIVAKDWLLRVLRIFAGRLVMRVNCQDRSPPSAAFGGTMRMISSDGLRALLTSTGWRITHWLDRRAEAMPSVAVWNSRAERSDLVADAHLDALRAWSRRVLTVPAEWAAANPLIEVVAEPDRVTGSSVVTNSITRGTF